MTPYKHQVKCYETDKMGITHHSNYVRFMEEARTDFLDQLGYNYAKLEESGIISPVVKIECKYKATTTYADVIDITVSVAEVKAAKVRFNYVMKKQDGTVCFEAASEHCFINREGKIAWLKREFPEFYKTMVNLCESK